MSDSATESSTGDEGVLRRQPRQKRSRQKVARILEAARTILEEEGPGAFNTNHIAKTAGVGVGSLYEYFPNKEAIALQLRESLSDIEAELILGRFEELESASFDELLPALVEVTFRIYREHHRARMALWALSGGDRTIGRRPAERRILDVIKRRLDAMHHSSDGEINTELHATVAFHIVESLATQMVAGERWDDETSATEVVRAVKAYLGALG